MDRIANRSDDLFDNSVMTFGEHLEELRQCLVRALLCLAGGLLIGLMFADDLVLYIQRPLEQSIRQFRADRDLTRLNFDPKSDENRPLRQLLAENSLVVELVYEIPEQYQTLPEALPPKPDAETADPVVSAIDMTSLLSSLPAVESLQPKVQLRQNETGLQTQKVEESFMIWFKAGLIVGAVIASPGIFYYIWSFVAAGLHSHERRYVYVYLPFSVGLFVSGVVLAFFLVLQYVLTFLLEFNGAMDVAVMPRLSYYVNFVLLLPLGFGIAFQLPLVMLFLQRIGLFETDQYIASWKIAILAIFGIAMVVTPADITSMIALAVPLVFLYALGIAMCRFLPRGRGLGSGAYDPA